MPTRKRAAVNSCNERAVLLQQIAGVENDGRVPRAFVDHLFHARTADKQGLSGKRLMQRYFQVARDHAPLIDPECRVGHAAGRAENRRHCWKSLEARALIDVFQLSGVHGVESEPYAECVQAAFAHAVAHPHLCRAIGNHAFIVQRHGENLAFVHRTN